MLNRWVTLLCLGLTALPLPARAADERISEEARAYFRNGVELLKAQPPNYQDAYYQFKLAYESSKSWKALGNLGLCAIQLERDGEALGYYEEYLKRGGRNIAAEEREAIQRDMLLIRGNTSALELTASAPNTELLDVRTGSTAPGQTYVLGLDSKTILLRAGTHTLTATDKEGRKLVWQVVLTPGKTTSHHFDFDAPPPEPAVTGGPTSAAPTPPHETRVYTETKVDTFGALRVLGVVGASLGVVALGSGVVLGLRVNSLESGANKRAEDPSVCDPMTRTCTDATIVEDIDDARDLAPIANALMIGGGVLTAAGLGLIVFGGSSRSTSTETSLNVVPVFSPKSAGLFASGSF